MAKRIQRKRTRGWRMPEGAVYVGRPTRWGNPYRIDETGDVSRIPLEPVPKEGFGLPAALVLLTFEFRIKVLLAHRPDFLAPLRGKDLACWCPLNQPCHADVLLMLANESKINR